MLSKDALKEIEVAEWEHQNRLDAIRLLKKIKANPIEQRKKPIRIDKRTVIYILYG